VNFTVVKFGTQSFAPLAFNASRMLLAAVALVVASVLIARPWPSRRDMLSLAGLGVLGNGIYQVLFVEGIARTRAGDAALVIAASPALIALVGRLVGVERVTRRQLMGIALSIAGIAFVVFGGTGTGGSGTAGGRTALLGDLLILAASLCWAFFTVFLKPYTERVDGVQLSALTMIGGTIPILLVAGPALAATPWGSVGIGGWSAVIYSGLLSLCVAYLFWYRGIRVIGPTRTAMYSNLQPVIALLVAWPTLGERPTLVQVAGMAAIMGGILLTRRK
jgi:drug/metabolite transporter (DMT)-like permease